MKYVTIYGVREENKTSKHFRNYNISDLLDKIDIILTEHGFIRLGNDNIDVETGGGYIVYEGLKGESIVRFARDESQVIPYFLGGKKEVTRCPIYIELSQVPDLIESSVFDDLKKI